MKVTNFKIIIFTLSLIVYSVLAAIDTDSGYLKQNEDENNRRCNRYCKQCGCMSFFCGEECICECNKKNYIEKDCITAVQDDAKKINVPFEILIQGPKANDFLVNVAKHSDKSGTKVIRAGRGKRSTVVIYRPLQSFVENEESISPMENIRIKIIEAKKELAKRQAEAMD